MTDDLRPTQDSASPTPTDPTTRVETQATPLTPTAATAPLAAVVATKPPRRPRSRFRWAISIAVVGPDHRHDGRGRRGHHRPVDPTRPSSATCRTNTVVYGEVRLDLPGRPAPRRRRVPLALPGLRRPGRAREQARRGPRRPRQGRHDGEQTYTTDIKPWFGGELAASARAAPARARRSRATTRRRWARSGPWRCCRSRTRSPPRPGSTAPSPRTARRRPRRRTRRDADAVRQGRTAPQPAFAIVDGKVAVAGDLVSVKAAIDTKGSGGFAKRARSARPPSTRCPTTTSGSPTSRSIRCSTGRTT